MPSISLVICLYEEKKFLQRLLAESEGCYDDLVVIHDGPDTQQIQNLVEKKGRFFERPRAYQQEPHWPFAWEQAKHDWILRLDADEFPGEELKSWIKQFRLAPEPAENISGFTCIWPLWNGKRETTRYWPDGRLFLFHRLRVSFFGMAEQTPIADQKLEPVPYVLHHHPSRKSYGIRNILLRKQAYRWRREIAKALTGKPTDLPCWRWTDDQWPAGWEELRTHPLRTGLFRLFWFPLMQIRTVLKRKEKILLSEALNPGLNHFLMGWAVWWQKYNQQRKI